MILIQFYDWRNTMGSKRGQRQDKSAQVSSQAREAEITGANQLKTELGNRKDIVGAGLPETILASKTGAEDLRATGGFSPETINPIRSGYSNMAVTGGFDPGQKESFLRRATSPITAMYARAKDELNRRRAIQGGGPGFTSSDARITRQGANAGADTSLNANVELNNQVRQGRMSGLGGLTTLATAEQGGKVAGQDALQRYTQMGIAGLSDLDTTELRNRLQTGQISQSDAQLLAQLASQDKSTFDKIMQGVQVGAGAVAGVAGAL